MEYHVRGIQTSPLEYYRVGELPGSPHPSRPRTNKKKNHQEKERPRGANLEKHQ